MTVQTLYRCEWNTSFRGVYVTTHKTSAVNPDPGFVWHDTEQKARRAVAQEMRFFGDDLLRQADLLVGKIDRERR